MGPMKSFIDSVYFWWDVLQYEVWWLVSDRHLDSMVVNIFDDIIVICWLDCTVSEVGVHYR